MGADDVPANVATAGRREGAVSVIMPVYNGERYLGQAIASMLRQTHPDFEFIIIDDGSTDRTAEILDDYARRDERLRVYHQANVGQPATLNRALGLARYDWVAIIDHDDVSLPHRLERQLALVAQHPEVRLVGSYALQIDASGQEFGRIFVGPTTIEEFQTIRAGDQLVSLVHPSVLLHRPTVLALGGYDPAFGPAMDTDLWSRVADEHLVLVVPEPLLLYRVHSRSMSSTRFFEQRRMERWIMARQLARRRGAPVPTLRQFLAAERKHLGFDWLRLQRDEWLAYFKWCRRLGRMENNRRIRLMSRVGLMLTSPGYLGRKVRRVTRFFSTSDT